MLKDLSSLLVLIVSIAVFSFYADTYSRDDMPTYAASWQVSE